MGTGVARGLQAVFAPPVDEPVIVASVPGDPPGEDERIRVILDPDDPTKSVAIVPERPAETTPLLSAASPANVDIRHGPGLSIRGIGQSVRYFRGVVHMSTLADVTPVDLSDSRSYVSASPTPGWPTCGATTRCTGRTRRAGPASGP